MGELPQSSGISSRGRWLALTAALLGWLFDGAEMGVFTMVSRPALQQLLGFEQPTEAQEKIIILWLGVMTSGFLVGAATGGVVFGWLGDRIGRVRAMTLSVFTYAFFTGLCGVVGEAWQVGALRFVASLGMGGEWSLGVALVMEVWPNRSRAFMAGLIGAAANVGYLLVGVVGLGLAAVLASMRGWLGAIGLPDAWVEMLVSHQGWRLMMILGTVPALLTFFIRLYVPESARWEEERGRGATSSWATRDLLAVVVGVLGPAAMIYLWAWDNPLALRIGGSIVGLVVVTAGYIYPVIRYLQRQAASGADKEDWRPTIYRMLLAACLGGVALLGTWGSTQQAPAWADRMTSEQVKSGQITAAEKPPAKEWTQIWLALGAIIGTISAALLGDWLGRRITYCLLCVLSLAAVFVFFQNEAYGTWFLCTAFIAGTFTAAFYGWLPLYLPELFRTRVRATGQGFGFNFGRILAAVGVLQLGNLVGIFTQGVSIGPIHVAKGLPTACTVLSLIYVVGMGIIWLAPETKGQPLPD